MQTVEAEKILNKQPGFFYKDGFVYHRKGVLDAMKKHTEFISIGVMEYIAYNKYRWLSSSKKWTNSTDISLTTEELYALYLNTMT